MNEKSIDRASAFGNELIRVHNWLRQSLNQIRESMASSDEAPVTQVRLLQAHCMGFCTALASEDREAFPALAVHVPELAPVLEEPERDHQLVAKILRRVEELVNGFDRDNIERARSELDGLAAILESHFAWEERRIVDALNSLVVPGRTAEDLLGISP
jgi:hemerythrin-like domain-containing protein